MIHRGERIEVMGELLRSAARSYPERRFVRLGDHGATYGEIDEQSDRLSGALQTLGVSKGDRVAIILPNCMEYIVAIYALAKLGAIQVPINTYLRGEFLRHQVGETESSVVLADDLGLRQLAPIMGALPHLKVAVGIGDCTASMPVPIESYSALMASGAVGSFPNIHADDLCSVLYTSGTTGASKGCMISHGYYTWIPEGVRRAGWSGHGDTIFGANPLFHMSGQNFLVANALTCGGEAVVEPVFHASTFMRRARETGATVVNAMGAMVSMILAQPPSPDDRDHKIRQATCVPTTPETWEEFYNRFGIRINSEIYGQTEFWPVTIRPAGSGLTPGGAGQLMSHVELKIVDDDDRETPTGEIGEIVLRPNHPNVMFSGYWNNPEATVRIFRNLWHHTGDSGRMDEMGTLYFADRKKDSMRRRGENVSSMELEEAILKHPSVAEVAVHAVPSALVEDEIKACIVAASGETLDPADLFQFFKTTLPYYAIPRYVEVMKELPRNPVNRVQKFILRERGLTPATWDLEELGLVVERSERRL